MKRSGVRFLIADDHVEIREALCDLLSLVDGACVVGQAGDGKEAVELAESLRPQVVIMDVRMPRMDGIEATRQIKARWPETKVIGHTAYVDSELCRVMTEAGAEDFITKGTLELSRLQELVVEARSADASIKA